MRGPLGTALIGIRNTQHFPLYPNLPCCVRDHARYLRTPKPTVRGLTQVRHFASTMFRHAMLLSASHPPSTAASNGQTMVRSQEALTRTSPSAARPRVDVEVATAARIELQTAHRWLSPQPTEHGRLVVTDAEVDCIAGQMFRAGRATHLGVVGSTAAGGVDLHGTKDGRHLIDDLTQPTVQTGR